MSDERQRQEATPNEGDPNERRNAGGGSDAPSGEQQPSQGGEADQPEARAPDSAEEPEIVADELPAAEEIERQRRSLQEERDDLYSRLQRVSADYQNYMRRAEQKIYDSVELARGDLLKDFIPVLDHFDRALEHETATEDGKALRDGLQMVRDELLKVLANAGVERIDPQPGDPFDPHQHEALYQQPTSEIEPNHVASAYQPGYVYGNRTLRPAKVAVAAQPPKGEGEGD